MRLTELTNELPKRGTSTQPQQDAAGEAKLGAEYCPAGTPLPDGLLAAVRFGPSTAPPETSLCIDVQLDPLLAAYTECWRANGPVLHGVTGSIRHASDAHHLFAVSEVDESECGGLRAAAQQIYTDLRRFQQQSGFPSLLRIWNYFDAINQGDGDQERYRQFCVGRGQGLGDAGVASYPAATAIGQRRSTGRLQVFWLASRAAGSFIENPRQVSAYRYPRTHGPVSPSFARATLTRDGALLISGTASIVGHLSRHAGNPLAQLDETLNNLAVLGAPVWRKDGECKAAPSGKTLIKVYVRDPANVDAIAAQVRAAFPGSPVLYLSADICRRELLLEIEVVRL